MASHLSQSTVLVVPSIHSHLDDSTTSAAVAAVNNSSSNDDADFAHRRDSEAAISSSSSGNYAGNAATSMAYLPHTVFLCELRHDAFEAAVPAGPSDSGLVSKWRPKDRVRTSITLPKKIDSVVIC